jgi:hypothetical protein
MVRYDSMTLNVDGIIVVSVHLNIPGTVQYV